MRLALTGVLLLLLGASCTPTRSSVSDSTPASAAPGETPAPPRPTIPLEPPPSLGPGMAEAYVRVDSCQAGACQGTVVSVGDLGRDGPMLAADQAVQFAVGTAEQALRQGAQPAFRRGAVLRLVLASEAAAGMVGGGDGGAALRVAEVRTPGLTR